MGKTTRKYVKFTGESVETIYNRLPYSKRKKRVRCPIHLCNSVMIQIQRQDNGKYNVFGFYCKNCNTVFIKNEFKVFKLEVIKE